MEWAGIAVLVAGQIMASRLFAGMRTAHGRMLVWPMVILAVAAADFLLVDHGAVARMAGICMVLLAGMKAVVYVEWSEAGRRRLGWKSHVVFGVLWFGMNPGAFQKRGVHEGGSRWVMEGLAMMVLGTLLALAVRWAGRDSVWALFVPMSLGFHFGALRVMAGIMRVSGFQVKPLFRNPFGAATPADFWAKRWNLGYSHMMSLAVGRPLVPLLGKHGSIFAVFLISGLLHELAITLPVRAGYGWPTVYFVLHGLLAMAPFHRLPAVPGRIATALAVMVPLTLLFPAQFRHEVLVPLMEILPGPNNC